MEIAEHRYEKVFERFKKALRSRGNITLSAFCQEQHTSYNGMIHWMVRNGYSVKGIKRRVAKSDSFSPQCLSDADAGVGFSRLSVPSSAGEDFSLVGITVTFNSGTTLCIKRGTPDGIIKLLRKYEGKEGEPCIP